jgi:hypothetical protein
VLAAALILFAAILAVANRFAIVAGEQGTAFKVDRWTGQTWLIFGREEWPVITHRTAREERIFK